MGNITFKLFILGFLVSCGGRRQEVALQDSAKDTLQIVLPDSVTQTRATALQLDTAYFKQRVDSLYTYINHKHKGTRLRVDTFRYNRHYWYYPFLDSAQYAIRYRFKPKPDTHLSFEVYEAHYTNQAISNDRFLKTYQEGVDTLGMPGLSYAYDFAIKKEEVIVALAVPCTFSAKNQQRLLKYFKAAFHVPIPADTLTCQCGFYCR